MPIRRTKRKRYLLSTSVNVLEAIVSYLQDEMFEDEHLKKANIKNIVTNLGSDVPPGTLYVTVSAGPSTKTHNLGKQSITCTDWHGISMVYYANTIDKQSTRMELISTMDMIREFLFKNSSLGGISTLNARVIKCAPSDVFHGLTIYNGVIFELAVPVIVTRNRNS